MTEVQMRELKFRFYLEEQYSIFGTSYYLVFREDSVCYGACTSPWEYLRSRLRRGVKFSIVEKPREATREKARATEI